MLLRTALEVHGGAVNANDDNEEESVATGALKDMLSVYSNVIIVKIRLNILSEL